MEDTCPICQEELGDGLWICDGCFKSSVASIVADLGNHPTLEGISRMYGVDRMEAKILLKEAKSRNARRG